MSYLDVFYLILALKQPFVSAAKKKAFSVPLFGQLLKKLQCIPVDRTSTATFLESYALASKALDDNCLLHIFPEGTFSVIPGIRPFRIGAFQLAVEKQIPIIPVVIRGARYVDWKGVEVENPQSHLPAGEKRPQ